MSSSPTSVTLELTPQRRFDLIDVARLLRSAHGELLDSFPRALFCSHHTTAGYLEQSLCARLQHRREAVDRFVQVFRKLFPPEADYQHDNMSLRRELTADERLREPRNADSHLAFIGSGLRNCITWVNRRREPVYFIDLDGVNGLLHRRRQTTVLAYTWERVVDEIDFDVPVSHHSADSVNLREERIGITERLDELVTRHGIGQGRIDLALAPEERCAGLTVNEYETLLMRHDLSEVLEDPFRFVAEKGRHILRNPLAVPQKTLSYAAYDLVHVFNELMDVLRVGQSGVERLLAKVTGGAASRFLRLRRSVGLAICQCSHTGSGEIVQGRYQSPILVQWDSPPGCRRRLTATLVEFE